MGIYRKIERNALISRNSFERLLPFFGLRMLGDGIGDFVTYLRHCKEQGKRK